MRIGVSSYSYSALVAQGKYTQFELIALARDMGFEFIEFAGLIVPEKENKADYASRLAEECSRVGIGAGNYTIGADFLKPAQGNWKDEVERLKKEVDIAAILQAPGMRHDVTTGRGKNTELSERQYEPQSRAPAESFDSVLPLLADACREVTQYAATKNIRTMLENHGYFCQDSDRVEKLISAVNHPNYGLLVDIGNFMCADEDSALAVGRIAPYGFHLHAKDFHYKKGFEPSPGQGWFPTRAGNWLRGAIIGHGVVPVSQCIRVMLSSGYKGDISIEFEGLEDPVVGLTLGLENLKRMIG